MTSATPTYFIASNEIQTQCNNCRNDDIHWVFLNKTTETKEIKGSSDKSFKNILV